MQPHLWVNGQYAGCHRGGYARFSFNIAELVKDGDNELVVKVEDSFDLQQPRGKQRWMDNSFHCWYVQTTGIWKTVWTEYVPKCHLDKVKMTPNMDDHCIELEIEVKAPESWLDKDLIVETQVSFEGKLVNRLFTAVMSNHVTARVDMYEKDIFTRMVKAWSPEKPNLYDIEFRLLRNGEVLDKVGSYVAMREIRIEGSQILLNGKPLYQRLILDQG